MLCTAAPDPAPPWAVAPTDTASGQNGREAPSLVQIRMSTEVAIKGHSQRDRCRESTAPAASPLDVCTRRSAIRCQLNSLEVLEQVGNSNDWRLILHLTGDYSNYRRVCCPFQIANTFLDAEPHLTQSRCQPTACSPHSGSR